MPWRDPSNWMPFMLSASTMTNQRWNMQRIIEALLNPGIAGGVSMYGTQQVLGARMESMSKEISRMEKQLDEIRKDFYRPLLSTENQPEEKTR